MSGQLLLQQAFLQLPVASDEPRVHRQNVNHMVEKFFSFIYIARC
jgi:hypothetical protein